MFNNKQVGRTFEILNVYQDSLEYHIIAKDNKTHTTHSLTLNLFNKLIMLDNNNFIEIYYLNLLY
jgi:hypothetical protein